MVGCSVFRSPSSFRFGNLKPHHQSIRFNFKKFHALSVSSDYSCFEVKGVTYRPPGTEQNLLNEVSFSLHEKSFGLIFGRSGSGKTTLLQLLAGLVKPTSGSIQIQRYGVDGNPNQSPELLSPERVGIVFQFPERRKGNHGWCKNQVQNPIPKGNEKLNFLYFASCLNALVARFRSPSTFRALANQ